MKEDASFPADVSSDIEAVLGALVEGRKRTTEQLAQDVGRPLARVRGALQLLKAARVLKFTTAWYGRLEGYARVWEFQGPGAVHLWEPAQDGRRRRLYVDRRSAVEASRRTMGPGAEARPVLVLVSELGRVGP